MATPSTIIFRVASASTKDSPHISRRNTLCPRSTRTPKGDAYLAGGFDVARAIFMSTG